LYNINVPASVVHIVGIQKNHPKPPLLGLGFLIFNRIYKLFRYGLSRLPGSDGLKFINRALSRIVVASYLPPSGVSVHLEVLNTGGSLLINLSLSLILSICTNSHRVINYISCRVAV